MESDGPLVLVADDDPDIVELLDFRLRWLGCRVLVARDGPSALAAIAESQPDLVVLDVGMPFLDGLDVCRLVRASGGRALGIIMHTARSAERDVARGLGAGADAYVTKPFAWPDLVGQMERVLAQRARPALAA